MTLETVKINDKGHLQVGGSDCVDLAEEFGTPLYVMDEELIRDNCRRYLKALREYYPHGKIIYAAKAFFTLSMAKLAAEEGLYIDIVSGGELYTALKAGFPPQRLYFHGNNKSREELKYSLDSGVGYIVVDSLAELEELIEVSREAQAHTSILLRIRPGVEAHTHEYIQTGKEDSKFGFGISEGDALEAVKLSLEATPYINLKGFHCHIGSQIFSLEPFKVTAEVMVDFIKEVRDKTGFIADELNMGGGLGIRHKQDESAPSIESYVGTIAEAVKHCAEEHNLPFPELSLEPGRSVTGEPGITLYRAGVIKDIPGIRRYISVDGGMMDNIRPALYDAEYEAILANKMNERKQQEITLAGKACESGDILIKDAYLPPVEKGDLIAVLSTGAYCYSMSNNYNQNPKPAVVFVRNGEARIVVKRETYEDIISLNELL